MRAQSGPSVVLLGMEGFGSQVLAHLVGAGVNVVGVVAPSPREPLSRREQVIRHLRLGYRRLRGLLGTRFTGLEGLAKGVRAPFLLTTNINSPEAIDWLRSLNPDFLCVATFNQLLKPAVLAVPRIGNLNVHPALLPHFRGPSPFFWQIREGCTVAGVTIHLIDAGEDSGDIVVQESFSIAALRSGYQMVAEAAQTGGRLLASAVNGLAEGGLSPRPQNSAAASRHPRPRQADGEVSSEWSCEHVVRFINLASPWVQPYYVWEGRPIRLSMAEHLPGSASVGLDLIRSRIILPCRNGRVVARVRWQDILRRGPERGV